MNTTPLPPVEIRQGGGPLRFDDEHFRERAHADLDFLQSLGLLNPDSKMLDLGCGPGRLAIGLAEKGWPTDYLGVEVNRRHIEWVQAEITPLFSNLRFIQVDAQNDRYNANGSAARQLPVDDDSLDIICAFSVFSHLRTHESVAYLEEIRRTLKPTGGAFISAYLADGVPDEVENPPGKRQWKGPLHCVQYSTSYFESLVAGAGLSFTRSDQPGMKQSGVVLRVAS